LANPSRALPQNAPTPTISGGSTESNRREDDREIFSAAVAYCPLQSSHWATPP
jgi:hypothetical protein